VGIFDGEHLNILRARIGEKIFRQLRVRCIFKVSYSSSANTERRNAQGHATSQSFRSPRFACLKPQLQWKIASFWLPTGRFMP
jgi:hypothetical protein